MSHVLEGRWRRAPMRRIVPGLRVRTADGGEGVVLEVSPDHVAAVQLDGDTEATHLPARELTIIRPRRR